MRKIRSKKNYINIRKGFCLFSSLSLVLILSLLLGSNLTSGQKVQAAESAEGERKIFSTSLETYLTTPGSDYSWNDYSNTKSKTRDSRLVMFYNYYKSQINSEIASTYGWPTKVSYETGLVNVSHNDTTADSGYDLYLLEFSTSNKISITNIDIMYSVYFIEQEDGTPTIRYTDAVELSKDSRDFLGRTDREHEFCKDEREMTTIQLPKGSIPVGVFVWQDGNFDDYAWEFSYLDMIKLNSISDVYGNNDSKSCSNNYRTYSGTRVAYIDEASIQKKYMASTDGGNTTKEGQYFEWLYPLTPDNTKVKEYVLEVVTNSGKILPDETFKNPHSVDFSLTYNLTNGNTGTSTFHVDKELFRDSHPYLIPCDYDTFYEFNYEWDDRRYANPIAKNAKGSIYDWIIFTRNRDSFPHNNNEFYSNYEMQDESFWIPPTATDYSVTKMNRFGAMMLGNYFDAVTLSYGYLTEYSAIQIPITLPVGIDKFTRISSSGSHNNKAGIQSIRVIELSESLAPDATTKLTFNGFFSPETVLGLKGSVIAETQGATSVYSGNWLSNSETNHKLINYDKNKIKVDTISDTFQGVTVTFSDTFGAGFDQLLADVKTAFPDISGFQYSTDEAMIYVFDDKKNPDNLGLPLYNLLEAYRKDPLTLTVTYNDTLGETRKVDIPFITAYLTQLIMDSRRIGDTDPSTWIAGAFQQGQTVGLRLNLSEFKSLISVQLYYGYKSNPLDGKLRPMEGDAFYTETEPERKPIPYDLTKDSIAIDNICFYDNVTATNFKAKYNGKGLTSTIETSLTPSSSWQASSEGGQVLTAERSLTACRQSQENSAVNMIDGAPIRDKYKDKYLVEITTLNNAIAGTVGNVSYQLHYTDTYGTSHSTSVINLHGAAKDFYGNSSRNFETLGAFWGISTTEFQYKAQTIMHLSAGSKFCFVTEIPNLKQFDGITLTTDGKDEWQPEQIRILKLTSLSERSAVRTNAFLGNLSAIDMPDDLRKTINTDYGLPTYRWDRTYTGTVLASALPNILLQSNKTSARINFTTHNADGTTTAPDTVIEEVKYLEKIPTTMTYEDTLMDLGLNIVKNTYQIHVDVANVADAGSSNYFYFQLLFENGRSGLVLANQQLPADSFRQGLTETFEIQTTQRYGEVKAVRIICEATASTASTFDKLNIDKITVTLNSQQGTGKSWIVDRVGWIDINYVDEVQQSYASDDNVILENSDLTLDFPVTSISSSTELMFVLTTGKQTDSTSANLNLTSLGDNIEGIVTYTDFQNTTRTVNIDLPQKIMDFNENEATSRILRSGTIDRFVLSLSDVKQIDSFTITRNEGKNADWLISDISINKVGGVGDVYLSSYTGEYIRNIEHSEYLTATTTKEVKIGLNDSKTFYFLDHKIEADISSEDNNAWNTTITRYPVSSDESLNIYVYLTNANGEPYKFSAGDNVDASVVYSSSLGTGALKASFKNIRAQSATDSSSLLFAQGLPIQSVGSLKSMELRGNFSSSLKPLVRCVYIEHVQGNVIKDTLYVPFNNASLALDKASANISSIEALTPMKQIVRLQPKENTSALLTPESSDIAVALRYTSSLDPESTKMVYQSPYVFLTDADYTILDNRNHIEVPFYLSGVGEIVGLTVISSGPTVSFENALITNYPKPSTTDGKENEVTTLLGSCSIAESFVSTNIISKLMKTSKDVTPVTFTFTTPKEDLVAGCGTSGQVGMLITYTDSGNNQQTYRINNILDYLPLDNPPFPDTVTSFNILMTDVAYLNSVTLTPATDDWFLTEVNAKVTTYDNEKQTTVNKTAVVNQWAKADGPLTIDMRPDSVNTDGPVINKITGFSISASAQQSKVSAAASSGNPLNIKVVAGDTISFKPTFQKVGNPTANINWAAYDYEQFFTDYNDGSATFAVPTEDTITKENLPKQYTLSAVCSENNSLAIPITIDVVSQEELDYAKDNTAKLTIMTVQGNKTISTATYNESDDITLEVPAERDANGTLKTSQATEFKFMASLSKETALFNVNDSRGLIDPESGAYELTVPANTTETTCKDCYLMFNVADAETETTYTITVSVVLKETASESNDDTITLKLLSDGTPVANTEFNESSTLTYEDATIGNTLSYSITNLPSVEGITYSVTADANSYADEMVFNPITDTVVSSDSVTGNLITIPSLADLNDKITSDLSYTNGSVTVPFTYDITITIPQHVENGNTVSAKTINGTITINVIYSDPNNKKITMVLKSNGEDLESKEFTPSATSCTYNIAEGSDVSMELTGSGVSEVRLESINANAKAVVTGAKSIALTPSSSTAVNLFTVPTLEELNAKLSGEKIEYNSDNTVTVDYEFKLIETAPATSGVMENTIIIRVTYTKPQTDGASYSLSGAGVGVLLN